MPKLWPGAARREGLWKESSQHITRVSSGKNSITANHYSALRRHRLINSISIMKFCLFNQTNSDVIFNSQVVSRAANIVIRNLTCQSGIASDVMPVFR